MGARRRVSATPGVAEQGDRGAPATARPPQAIVPRSRVQAFLDGVPAHAATLVVAPAGSGKTAGLAYYTERARAAGLDVTWVRPDRVDRLAEALDEAAGADAPPVIVVDDAHLLPDEGAALLARVLTEAPGSVRLVLAARRELEWVPVSALLSGEARTICVDDLRFTGDEAAALVRMHFADATDNDIAAILEQGDGWAAALVLGSRALRAAGDSSNARAALAATRRPALDYLLHEVFETLPADLVRVLLTTCQQDHVTAEEATLLSDVPTAGDLLAQAAASGLLVTGYHGDTDDDQGWRYHPLLLDLLRRRTAPTGPDWPLVVEAHHRACAEYVDRRDAERAVLHARLTGDLDLQLRVLREFSGDLISRGRTSLVADALAAIPVAIRSRHQDLLVLHATVLRSQGRIDAAKVAADRALAADARHLGGGVTRDVDAELAALELWQARYGWREAEPALERAGRVLGCHHDGEVSAHDLAGLSPVRAHWLILELAAFETWLGRVDTAAIHVQDAAMYANRVDFPVLERSVLSQRAVLELVCDLPQTALASADAALALHDRVPGPPDVADARIHLARGWAQLQALEIPAAGDSLTAFDATPRELLDPLLLVYGRLLRASLLAATGEVATALRLLEHRGEVPERLPPAINRAHQMIRMLLEVALGDLGALEQTVRAMRAAGLASPAQFAEAWTLGLTGQEQRAVRLLDGLANRADVPPTIGLMAAVTRAALLHRIGTASAVDAAERAVPDLVSRAAPQRMLATLSLGILISPGFLDLLAAHAGRPGADPWAVEAYAAISRADRPFRDIAQRRGTPPEDADPRTVLTPRELEVLEQLALGGGNADLARALFVSENTVKTHLASIYRKLDVERRVDALRVARQRGLI